MAADPERVGNIAHMHNIALPSIKEEETLSPKNNVIWPLRLFVFDRIRRAAFERHVKDRFPIEVTKAIKGHAHLDRSEMAVIERVVETDWSRVALNMAIPEDIEFAAHAMSLGAVLCRGFGNFYSVDAHPCSASVVHVNRSKGRPDNQVGSVTTVKDRIHRIFDWSQLPSAIDQDTAMSLIDELYEMGPFGFRGPASKEIPDHLTAQDGDKITTQIIAPGYKCPSNALIARVLDITGENFVFITSANVSHNLKGTTEEPAHFKMDGIQADFGHRRGFVMLSHADEQRAVLQYESKYRPMSTTILAIHKITYDRHGQPQLFLERHGSMHIDDVLEVVKKYGFGLEIGPRAQSRLPQRHYPN